jgi:hypothetical protein
MDEIHALIHPPQPVEPTVIVVQEGGGDLLFDDLLQRRW